MSKYNQKLNDKLIECIKLAQSYQLSFYCLEKTSYNQHKYLLPIHYPLKHDCKRELFVSFNHCYRGLCSTLLQENNYDTIKGTKNTVEVSGIILFPVRLMIGRFDGLGWQVREFIRTINDALIVDENSYYEEETKLLNEEIPSWTNEIIESLPENIKNKVNEDWLNQYISESFYEICDKAGEHPFLDGGEYPYLHINDKVISATIELIESAE